jgi:hypothetical protein
MRFTSEEFYKHFFCGFQEYVKQNRNRYEKTLKDAAWTRYVKDGFLCELAKNLGFKETKEGVYGLTLHGKSLRREFQLPLNMRTT